MKWRSSASFTLETLVPGLTWSTFLGGSEDDDINDIVLHADDRVSVLGTTESMDYPLSVDALDGDFGAPLEATVTALSSDASGIVTSTFLGGSSSDRPRVIALGADGCLVIAGSTASPDYPVTTGAVQAAKLGVSDAFVTVMSEDGDELLHSTFLGGQVAGQLVVSSGIVDMAIAGNGDLIVLGQTSALDFPTTAGVVQPDFPDVSIGNAVFVTRIRPDLGSLVWSTFVGGDADLTPRAIAVGDDDEVTVVCSYFNSSPAPFPSTPGTVGQPPNPLGSNAAVLRLSGDASQNVYATLVNATNGLTRFYDVVDVGGGEIVLAGFGKNVGGLVTPGAFQPALAGFTFDDALVVHLSAGGTSVLWGSYLGGVGSEDPPIGIVVEPDGTITVAGTTASPVFPVTPGVLQPTKAGTSAGKDFFVSRFHPDGHSLSYSTFLGGPFHEQGASADGSMAMALFPDGSLVLAGVGSPGWPTTPGAVFEEAASVRDGVVAKVTLLPAGVDRFGAATPADGSGPKLSVHHAPILGSTDFALLAQRAPAAAVGFLGASANGLGAPLPAAGVGLWLDPGRLALRPWSTDERGFGSLRLPLPGGAELVGLTVSVQGFWPGGQGWVASDALRLEIQAP